MSRGAGGRTLRVATCLTLPEPDVDEAPLATALAAAGIEAQLLAWDDPRADWDAPLPTIIRSTWNYVPNLAAYLAWIDRIAAVAPLFNPPDIVHANVHKRYLLELEARGVPIVPTTLVERAGTAELPRTKVVIKPEVGGGSIGTKVFDDGRDGLAHLHELTSHGAALIQPYIDSVDDYGERSVIWIDGALTHAIRKTPRFAGDSERIEGPFPIADDERAVATAALAPYVDRILYGRVDMARDHAGQPRVMELELIEPSLFFARGEGSVERYVAGLARRLSW
jgi:glutathione synthase/RimK-type ligase-like ATP-grasp enzyme